MIDKYYEELENLEQKMRAKRQEARLRAFGQMEGASKGDNTIKQLQEEYDRE